MEPNRGPRPVVVLVYDGVAADEAGIVVDILAGAGLAVVVAGVGSDAVTSHHGRVITDRTAAELADCSALVVPGGMGVRQEAADRAIITAIRRLSNDATWLGAISTGSVLLAAAGVIDGARATTHWLAGDLLTARGVTYADEPVVEDGRLLTASGTASAPRLAFRLVGALAGPAAEAEARASYPPRRRTSPGRDRSWPAGDSGSVWARPGRRRSTPGPGLRSSFSTWTTTCPRSATDLPRSTRPRGRGLTLWGWRHDANANPSHGWRLPAQHQPSVLRGSGRARHPGRPGRAPSWSRCRC